MMAVGKQHIKVLIISPQRHSGKPFDYIAPEA